MKRWKKRMDIKIFLFWLLVVGGGFTFGGINEAIAKDYFVAVANGKDGNAGTKEAPFLTLEKGVSVLLPGDTLNVRGGTYQRSKYLWSPPNGDSWENAITIKNYKGEKVTVKPLPGYSVFEFEPGSQFIVMDGFIIDAKGGHGGIRTGEGSHHIRIMNGEVMNAPSQGILAGKNSEYFEFINLRIHDNGTTDLDHGIYLASNHHLVKDCSIYRNAGWGVHIYSSGNRPSFNVVMNNKIFDNARLGHRGAGIGLYSGEGNMAINNLIWGSLQIGIQIHYDALTSKVYNNTVYGNKSGILVGTRAKNSKVVNNISYNNSSNNFENAGENTSSNNNLTENPLFIDASKRDFHLQSGSPAILAGSIISEVAYDFEYKPRSSNANYDIGAFQAGESLAPPTALKILNR
ncbi:MAG: hypothetical protein NPIRA03_22720 [Nitrospirales bacterium]|nr:MAG: hypothetical protein NPIRA03_22720 [Nitrospirales bacterium]